MKNRILKLAMVLAVVPVVLIGCGVKLENIADTESGVGPGSDSDSLSDSGVDSSVDSATNTEIDPGTDSSIDSGTDTEIPVYQVEEGGYVVAPPWRGYAGTSFSGEGTTIEPADFSGAESGESLCIFGTIGAMPDWSGSARIVINLNQEKGPGTPALPATIEPSGLYVDIAKVHDTEVRVNLVTSTGTNYCAVVRATGGAYIAWTAFNTACWNDSGQYYALQPVTSLEVYVPGHNADDRLYNFCVNEFYPVSEAVIDTEVDTGDPIDTDLIPTDWNHGYVGEHGALQVVGSELRDRGGVEDTDSDTSNDSQVIALRGLSLYWSQWAAGKYFTADVVDWLKTDWHSTVVRAAMGVNGDADGYLVNPTVEVQKVTTVVNAAIEAGIYVIIDWHDHHANLHPYDARAFFETMAKTYGEYPNVIYELWNEPLDVRWSTDIKPYAEFVMEGIRKHDPDNLILVGTPQWSQRVDHVVGQEIDDPNVAYVLHFYSGQHSASLRTNGDIAMANDLPVFISEWGVWNTGYIGDDWDNPVDTDDLQPWLDWMEANNLSSAMWSCHDKDEPSAVLKPGASTEGGWTDTDLTTIGNYMHEYFQP